MAKRSAFMTILSLMFMCFGIKFQTPVKMLKMGRSIKYRLVSKALAGSGKKKRSSKKRTTYKRRPGR